VTTAPPVRARRRYDNTRRRAHAEQTRADIVTAGVELLRASSIRDWRAVTIRAVATRAGVNERTVYRHFASERVLRDAVMHRLEQDAGIDLTEMRFGDITDVAARIFRHVSQYPSAPRPPLDPTLVEASRRQHEALLGAVAGGAPRWTAADRTLVAAMFDVLWGVASYERLVAEWGLDRDEAIRAVTWVVGLVQDAVREGRPPPGGYGRPAQDP
jgi:AcrR family transcriptional regulator